MATIAASKLSRYKRLPKTQVAVQYLHIVAQETYVHIQSGMFELIHKIIHNIRAWHT